MPSMANEYVKSWKLGRVLGRGLCGVVREAEIRPGEKVTCVCVFVFVFVFFGGVEYEKDEKS